MSGLRGLPFLKMSGSGNDFIVFDAREVEPRELVSPERIRALCTRGVGVGSDGVVVIERGAETPYAMRYFNADGSEAALCGNATLCAARLGSELGIIDADQAARGFRFTTGVGAIEARFVAGQPEIELALPVELRLDVAEVVGQEPNERRLGHVVVGVPHVVILCEDAESAPVLRRGAEVRRHAAFPQGANVNFVSPTGEGWRYRTFERGVENETLACGTGAAACAILLREWGHEGTTFTLRTTSGSNLRVSLDPDGQLPPKLSGPARIVYRGELEEI